MKARKDAKNGINRRDFIKGTAAGAGVAVAARSGLLGRSTAEAKETGQSQMYSFETPPPQVASSQIVESLTTDVVVVGGGPAGTAAAASAAESGANTVLLEKYYMFASPGGAYAALGTKKQIQEGFKFDLDQMAKDLVAASIGRSDARLIRAWANNSGPVMDWRISAAEATGKAWSAAGTTYMFGVRSEAEGSDIRALIPYMDKVGVTIRYDTAAVQLIRPDNNGRVMGVIAKGADGGYVQYNVNKAVILCTGGYTNNPEIMQKYMPWVPTNLIRYYTLDTDTGDGLQMGLWIGADVLGQPHMPMIHFNGTNASRVMKMIIGGMGSTKGYMNVNKLGERFANEDFSLEKLANQVLLQPDHTQWLVFDAKSVTDSNRAAVGTALKTGEILIGNTVEELAPQFGARAETFRANVDRYNELVDFGVDLDFGRSPIKLKTRIDTPPYYVQEMPPSFLTTCGGLRVNTKMQVLDTNREVIPGLYAAGNTIGGFFGDSYPMEVLSGIARGHALTFGRVAGLNVAAE
jgi:fumarate reductase flavoprotein subunit